MSELAGARVLVAGASGVLGGLLGAALVGRGARVVAAGRDEARTTARGREFGTDPVLLDVVDERSVSSAVEAAVAQLGGLDGVVVAVGAAAFGPAADTPGSVAEEVFAVNALGPMGLVRAAVPHLGDEGFVLAVSAILADAPMAGLAEYSAAKAAFSVWLGLLRREMRPLTVVDVRPPHLDTGLADRALAGTPPRLPPGFDPDRVVDLALQAVAEGRREVRWDAAAKDLVLG